MKKLTKEEIITELEKPNGSATLAADERVDKNALLKEAAELYIDDGLAGALIVRLVKSKALLVKLSENAGFLAAVRREIEADSPKKRRNAAKLLGAISRSEEDAKLLAARLETEDTRFVRPSLLLALGSVGGDAAEAVLSAYTPAPPADDTENKHYEDEVEALKLARASCVKREKHAFTELKSEYEIELAAPDRLTGQLAKELDENGLSAYDIKRSSLKVRTKDYTGLFSARCFSEALFVMGGVETLSPEAVYERFAAFVPAFMRETHSGGAPYRYRIEVRGENADFDITAFKKSLRDLIDAGGEFVNAPGDYEAELRVETAPRGARVYLKLFTVRDERFLYRRQSLPASMNPSTAAAVLRFAEEWLTVNARVIDPCCGSGTLLIERGLLSPCDSLTGVDIAHRAVDAARINADAAAVLYGIKQAKFIVNDILRFEAKRPYDELICNLPFGNRVGDHSSCERLYKGLIDKLPSMLKKGGVAILYTMEFTLLKNLIRENGRIELLSQGRTEAGGLTPMIFILKVK
ncbi:MAG: methyltransferase domain-containing protein [Clostridia bacterium]|nr:methyltransferase domain-containing protein [Clostridia bacterium]